MNDMTPMSFRPSPRDMLAEAALATAAVASFDLGCGPKLFRIESEPHIPELTEAQLVGLALQRGLIPS